MYAMIKDGSKLFSLRHCRSVCLPIYPLTCLSIFSFTLTFIIALKKSFPSHQIKLSYGHEFTLKKRVV